MLQRVFHIAFVAVALLTVAWLPAAAQDQTKQVYGETPQATKPQTAETPAEHEAAAQRFDKEAAEFDKQAAEHEKMAADYRQRARLLPKANYADLATHCEHLAKNLKDSAAQAREMSRLHHDMARLTNH